MRLLLNVAPPLLLPRRSVVQAERVTQQGVESLGLAPESDANQTISER
jgi:hypothetical protein